MKYKGFYGMAEPCLSSLGPAVEMMFSSYKQAFNTGTSKQQVLSRGVKDGYSTAKVQWIKDSPIPEERLGN